MRILLCLILITACSPKVKTTTPPQAKALELERVLKAQEKLGLAYSSNTESMFALLWPINFDREAKQLLVKSLKIARDLQQTRRDYTSESTRLRKSNQKNQCECVLSGICETEPSPSQQEESLKQCTELETEQLKNDERLSTLLSLQEELKSSVLQMGGYWLEIPTPPTYEFSTGDIDFKDAEFFNGEGKSFGLKLSEAFWKLDTVKIDGALQAQGELKVKLGDRIFRGELGFQLPERGE